MPEGNGNSNGWQKPAIAGLWAIVLLFAGWLWISNGEALRDASDKREALAGALSASQARIATLEEANRNTQAALTRIEEGVNELRRERRQR